MNKALRSAIAPAGRAPGRNDPCPCGSGRKYKNCCAIAPRGAAPAAPFGPLTEAGQKAPLSPAARALRDAAPQAAGHGKPHSAAIARLLRDARQLAAAGRPAEVVPLLQQAAQLDPANPRIRLDLGIALLHCERADEAADSLAHAIWLDDTAAPAHYQLGIALTQKSEVSAAIEAFQAAIARDPKLADAYARLAALLHSRGRAEDAAEAFEKAAHNLGNSGAGRLAAAYALVMRNQRGEAIALLQRARALHPKALDLTRLLAMTLAEMGRFAEAEEQFSQALALDPGGGIDCYELTKLRKLTEADRPLIGRMTARLQRREIGLNDRMLLHFGLGKAHDDLREFAAAMANFDAANRIRGRAAPLNRRMVTNLVNRNIGMFPDRGRSAASPGVDDERPVLIVGLPRSGTTLVEQILSSHPAVAAGGEQGYWGERGASLMALDKPPAPDGVQTLAAGYQAVLRAISPDAARVTDKNPFNYLYLGLIRLAFPRAFIIHVRRHPVDNCLSMYMTYLAPRDTYFMGNRDDLVFYHGLYTRMMQHWRGALPPDRFLEIDYAALTADREAETRRLVSFCELDWNDACLHPERNLRMVATASVWQARQPVYRSSVERWRNYRPWLGELAELLPEAERTA